MGADYVTHFACEQKLVYGNGDALAGTKAMMTMVKARTAARMIEQNLNEQDPSVHRVSWLRSNLRSGEQHEEQTSLVELLAQAATLNTHANSCAGCPANFASTAQGCYNAIPYPITAVIEKWVVDRLQPANTLGGVLLTQTLSDFGKQLGAMRSAGMFELSRPAEKIVQKRFLRSTLRTGDEIFTAIFALGGKSGAIGPDSCALLLFWVGALEINGAIPTTVNDSVERLNVLASCQTPEERRQMTKLQLGPESPDLRSIQDLLRCAYTSWLLNVDLLLDV